MTSAAALRCRGVMLALMCLVTGLLPAQAHGSIWDESQVSNKVTVPDSAANTQDAKITNEPTTSSKIPGSNASTLNFVDADIEWVITAVGDYTNTTFIIDPRVKGTLTLESEKPLTKSQAYQLLTSVLRLRDYVVVAGNGYIKVLPEADAKLQAGPLQSTPSQSDLGRRFQVTQWWQWTQG